MNAVSEVTVENTRQAAQSNLARRHLMQKIVFGGLWAIAGFVILVLFFILGYLFIQGGKFFVGAEDLVEEAITLDSNQEIVDEVIANINAVGYVSFGYLDETTNAISINGVAPTVENVESGAYPIQRDLYLVVGNTEAVRPEVQAYLDFIASAEGQAIVADTGYIPLNDVPAYVPVDDLSGEITIDGSTTVHPLALVLAEAFEEYYPAVTFTVDESSSNDGVKRAGKEKVDIGMSSRDLLDYEFIRYENLDAYVIASDGIAIISNNAMAISDLSMNQVRSLFTGAIENWTEVGGGDAEIMVLSRAVGSGTWSGFEKWVLSKSLLIEKAWETKDWKLLSQSVGASFNFVGRFLVSEPEPGMGGKGGISTTITTTVYLVLLTLIIAAPLGVGAGVYLVEYAGEMGGQTSEEVSPPAWWRYAVYGVGILVVGLLIASGIAGRFWAITGYLIVVALSFFILIGVFYGNRMPKWWILLIAAAVLAVLGLLITSVSLILYGIAVLLTIAGVLHAVGLMEPLVGSVGPSVVPTIRFAVETLSGVPSIIFGLFGFALFVSVMHLGLSMLSGALAGACMILPVLIRTTEEALLTVPRSYREGSLALGATKWQTNFQVVLPAALPGIVTGIILGVSRIVSETAVFYVTLGGSIHAPESIMDQGRTMVLHLYSLMMDANAPEPAMGTAVVLVIVIVFINMAINYFSNRLSTRLSGNS